MFPFTRLIASTFIMIVLCSAFAGCTSTSHSSPSWFSMNPDDWSNRSSEDPPVLLDVIGALAVDVQSFNGDVMISGNPDARQASVRVVREGVQGHRRSKEAAASLDDISSTVEIVGGEMGQVLQVRTATTNPEPHFQRAHVLIEVPQIDGVTVHTQNGRVYVKNVAGAVDISTTEQEVRVMTNQRMVRPVTIVNRNGDIHFRIRGESTAMFDCETVDGKVFHNMKYGRVRIQSPTDRDTLTATLNDGTNLVRLRTVRGDIKIAVVHNPEEVGQFL